MLNGVSSMRQILSHTVNKYLIFTQYVITVFIYKFYIFINN